MFALFLCLARDRSLLPSRLFCCGVRKVEVTLEMCGLSIDEGSLSP